jgi:hypothetical protein
MTLDRQPINWDDSLREVLLKMAEDNTSALKVMTRMLNRLHYPGLSLLFLLDDMNIRGTQIFVGYKYHCQGDLDRFIDCIRSRDPEMVDAINREGSKGKYPHKAVTQSSEGKKREFLED